TLKMGHTTHNREVRSSSLRIATTSRTRPRFGAAPCLSLAVLPGAAPAYLLFFIFSRYIPIVHKSAEDKGWRPRSEVLEAGLSVSLSDGANGPERDSGGRGGAGESAPYDEPGAGAERTAKASPADFRAVFDDAPAPLVVITPDDYVIVA